MQDVNGTFLNAQGRHFKAIATKNIIKTLRWFEKHRLENRWKLTHEEQLVLLGNIDSDLYQTWLNKVHQKIIPNLPPEVLLRLSILVGVEKSLWLLTPDDRDELAYEWFLTPNKHPVFAGKSIKECLLSNNTLESFYAVEDYLIDAVTSFLGGAYS